PRRPAVDELDGGPAVVASARLLAEPLRLLAEPLRLLPRGRGALDRSEPLANRLRRLRGAGGDETGPLRADVAHCQDARRGAGLAEPLVVLAHLADEVGGRPDLDRPVAGASGRGRLGRRGDDRDDER